MTTIAGANDFLEFALDAVWQAGRITLGHFQTRLTAERKYDNSPVTIADRQAEQKLRELIAQYWPDHGIIGEEYGEQRGSSQYTWVIDPIDGTKSFVAGVPMYSNLLALLDGQDALIGIVNFPALNETVYGVRGGGAFWNGRRARVSTVSQLSEAVLLASDLDGFVRYRKAEAWQRLLDSTYIQRTWGDAYGYCLIATGRAEVMVDPRVELWDAAPLKVILEEAGGTFSDWKGEPTIHHNEAVATNGVLFEQVMKTIRGES